MKKPRRMASKQRQPSRLGRPPARPPQPLPQPAAPAFDLLAELASAAVSEAEQEERERVLGSEWSFLSFLEPRGSLAEIEGPVSPLRAPPALPVSAGALTIPTPPSLVRFDWASARFADPLPIVEELNVIKLVAPPAPPPGPAAAAAAEEEAHALHRPIVYLLPPGSADREPWSDGEEEWELAAGPLQHQRFSPIRPVPFSLAPGSSDTESDPDLESSCGGEGSSPFGGGADAALPLRTAFSCPPQAFPWEHQVSVPQALPSGVAAAAPAPAPAVAARPVRAVRPSQRLEGFVSGQLKRSRCVVGGSESGSEGEGLRCQQWVILASE